MTTTGISITRKQFRDVVEGFERAFRENEDMAYAMWSNVRDEHSYLTRGYGDWRAFAIWCARFEYEQGLIRMWTTEAAYQDMLDELRSLNEEEEGE